MNRLECRVFARFLEDEDGPTRSMANEDSIDDPRGVSSCGQLLPEEIDVPVQKDSEIDA